MKYIALFSPPRSGSSWLGQIFNSSPFVSYKFQPNFAYSFDYNLTIHSEKDDIDFFLKKLSETNDPFVNAEISISGKKNHLFEKSEAAKTLVFKETHYQYLSEALLNKSKGKVVGLLRNPFATLNSWLKTPKEFHPDWDVKSQWKDASLKNEGKSYTYFGYNKWKEVAFLFLKLKQAYPQRFYLLAYEDLLADRVSEIQKLFEFAALEYTAQTAEFLNDSGQKNDQDAYSVFKVKDKDNSWENELPSYIIEEIKNDEDFKLLNETFKWI